MGSNSLIALRPVRLRKAGLGFEQSSLSVFISFEVGEALTIIEICYADDGMSVGKAP